MERGIIEQAEKVIAEKIRPFIEGHGGSIALADCRDGVAFIRLQGACAGCPSADLGTKEFVKEVLRSSVPGIHSVELEQTTDPELLQYARQILYGNQGS